MCTFSINFIIQLPQDVKNGFRTEPLSSAEREKKREKLKNFFGG